MNRCECGCGAEVNRRWVLGHHRLGKPSATRGRPGPNWGREWTEEQNQSRAETLRRLWRDPEYRQRMVEAHQGRRLTEEHRAAISSGLLGNQNTLGVEPWNKGKKMSIEYRQKLSAAHGGPGGSYPLGFDMDLKEQIRDRDGRRCVNCGMDEKDSGERLCVHHIDRDKQNIDDSNLVSVCRVCHQTVERIGNLVLQGVS